MNGTQRKYEECIAYTAAWQKAPAEAMSNSEKINPVALAIVDSSYASLKASGSQSVRQLVSQYKILLNNF